MNCNRDRFRTAINVFGDSIGCGIVQHLSKKELADKPNEQSKALEIVIAASSVNTDSTRSSLAQTSSKTANSNSTDVPVLESKEGQDFTATDGPLYSTSTF